MKTKEKKNELDKVTNTRHRKLKKSPKDTTKKKYELVNVVSETGDSIYSLHYEEFTTLDDIGQAFFSETAIEKLGNLIIDQQQQRVGASLNKDTEDD